MLTAKRTGSGVTFAISAISALAAAGVKNVSMTTTPSSPTMNPALPEASPPGLAMVA